MLLRPCAIDRHRRIATRRSWTGSALNPEAVALFNSATARSAQNFNPVVRSGAVLGLLADIAGG